MMVEQFAGSAHGALERDWHDEANEDALIVALCSGSEAAFALLVEEYHAAMVRVASLFVGGYAAAEDVVQDVWLIVFRGIDRFERRSSLKTWVFRILTNRAKSVGQREGRCIPMATMSEPPGLSGTMGDPESHVLTEDALAIVHRAIGKLPLDQRRVIVLRDIEGRGAKEVCGLLNLTDANQRVLLHRARAQIRRRMQGYHGLLVDDEVA